jgi:hypothetical protein
MLEAIGRRSRGPGLGEIRGQTKMAQDAFHRAGVFDERKKPQPAATARTLEHVESKRPSHQIGPAIRAGSTRCRPIAPLVVSRARCGGGRSVGACRDRRRDNLGAPRRAGASTP